MVFHKIPKGSFPEIAEKKYMYMSVTTTSVLGLFPFGQDPLGLKRKEEIDLNT